MSRFLRKGCAVISLVIVLLGCAVVVLAVIFLEWADTKPPSDMASWIPAKGTYDVEILRDEFGVHIYLRACEKIDFSGSLMPDNENKA